MCQFRFQKTTLRLYRSLQFRAKPKMQRNEFTVRSAISKMVTITIVVHEIIIRMPVYVAYHLTFVAQVHNSRTRVLSKQILCHSRLFVCFSPCILNLITFSQRITDRQPKTAKN